MIRGFRYFSNFTKMDRSHSFNSKAWKRQLSGSTEIQTLPLASQPIFSPSIKIIGGLAGLGLIGTGGYLGYTRIRDAYYDFPVVHGISPDPDDKTFVKTEGFEKINELLQESYIDRVNIAGLIGQPGSGKSFMASYFYKFPDKWFRRKKLLGQVSDEPWLKAWVSISQEDDESGKTKFLENELLTIAKKVQRQAYARINEQSWLNWIIQVGLKPILPALPKSFNDAIQNYMNHHIDEDNTQKTLTNLKYYLERCPGWLMVFDNLEDYEKISNYLPTKGGIVLFTSNNRDLGVAQKVFIEGVLEDQALAFLEKTLAQSTPQKLDLIKLIDALSCRDPRNENEKLYLPLVLSQISGYINATGDGIDKVIKALEERPDAILNEECKSSFVQKHPSLVKTLDLHLKQFQADYNKSNWFRKVSPEERLLMLMTIFAPLKVKESQLKTAFIESGFDEAMFEQARYRLLKHSLLQQLMVDSEANGDSYYTMHQLNHKLLSARFKEEIHGEPSILSKQWWSYYLPDTLSRPTLLDGAFKAGHHLSINWKKDPTGYFHLRHMKKIKHTSKKKYHALPYAELLLGYVDVLGQIYQLPESERDKFIRKEEQKEYKPYLQEKKESLQKVLSIQQAHYGKNDVQAAATLHSLGVVLYDLGDHSAAKERFERALVIKEAYYGQEHIEVALTLNNLGIVLIALGDSQSAKALLERVLRIQEVHYGQEHVVVAGTLNNLGNTLGALGDYLGKKTLLERALAIQEAHYGKEHVAVASTLNNLGNVLGALGDYLGKKDLLKRALAIKEAYYGQEHVAVASTLVNLGNVLGDLGNYLEKKTLLERALGIQEANYGKEHVAVARTLGNLGAVLGYLGDYQASQQHLEQALPILQAGYGKDHVEFATALGILGIVLTQLGGDYQAASQQRLEQALLAVEASERPQKAAMDLLKELKVMKSTPGYEHNPELSIFEIKLNNLINEDIESSQTLGFPEQSSSENLPVSRLLSSSGNGFFQAPLSNSSSPAKKEAESSSVASYTSE